MLLKMLGNINTLEAILALILFLIIPLLFSLAFHELAHGYVAYKFGDPTAKAMGRLTLNPFKHLDITGTILLLVVGLGWAKPVPVNILNIPNRTHQMLVALAGPLANIILAIFCAILLMIHSNYVSFPLEPLTTLILGVLIRINLGLAVFNLLPIPPLDGSKVIMPFLPYSAKQWFQNNTMIFYIVFLIIFVTGIASTIISPAMEFISDGIINFAKMIFGL